MEWNCAYDGVLFSEFGLLEASVMFLAPLGFHFVSFTFLLCLLGGAWHGHLSSLDQVDILFQEGLDAATE